MEQFIVGAATVLLTFVFTVAAEVFRQKRAEDSERRKEIRVRSDEAAHRLLDLMEEARDVFSDEPQHGLPDDVQNLCHRIDKDAVLVAEPIVRDAMFAVVSALWHATDLLPETFQTTPKSI